MPVMDLERLQGNCPCCGKVLEATDFYFHPQSGTLILRGQTIHINPSESVIFKILVKAFPRSMTPDELHNKYCVGRAGGGPDRSSTEVTMAKLRKKLEQGGITISRGGHYLLVPFNGRKSSFMNHHLKQDASAA